MPLDIFHVVKPLISILPILLIYEKLECCDNFVMTLVIVLSLKTIELLENGLQSHSGVVSMMAVSLTPALTLTFCVNWVLAVVMSLAGFPQRLEM